MDRKTINSITYILNHIKVIVNRDMMRSITYLILILTGMTLLSCNRLSDPQVTVPVELNFDIPASLNTIETYYFTNPNTPIFLDLNLSQSGFTSEDITSIISQNARVTEIDENVDLNFINSIVINAYTDDDNVELFYLENIQFGSKDEIFLLASISELVDILNQEFVSFEVGFRFRQVPPANFRASVTMDFSVYAGD